VPRVRLIAFRIAEAVNGHGHVAPDGFSGEADSLIVKEHVVAVGIDPNAHCIRSMSSRLAILKTSASCWTSRSSGRSSASRLAILASPPSRSPVTGLSPLTSR
jgi:hypothetical protein